MIESIILALPAITCLLCMFMMKLKKKDRRTSSFTFMMFFSSIYFIHYAMYNSHITNYYLLSYMNIIVQWVTFALVPSAILYLYSLSHRSFYRLWMTLMYLPAVVQGTLSTFLFFAIGPDNVAQFRQAYAEAGTVPPGYDTNLYQFYYYITEEQFYYLGMLSVVVLLAFIIWFASKIDLKLVRVFRFIFKKGESTTEKTIVVLAFFFVILMSGYAFPPTEKLYEIPYYMSVLSILLAVNLFYLGYVNLVHYEGAACTYYSLTHMTLDAYVPKVEQQEITQTVQDVQAVEVSDEASENAGGIAADAVNTGIPDAADGNETSGGIAEQTAGSGEKDSVADGGDAGQGETEEKETAAVQSASENKSVVSNADVILFERLNKLMQEEQLFLEETISMDSLASRLHSNRTYLSRVINQFYQVSFREYINLCRIEYAMAYMRENPQHTQELIAMKCGFPNAQTFSRKFKEIVGTTPKQWLMTT